MPTDQYERMYLRRGRRAHLISPSFYGQRVAVCGRYPWPEEFRGTGTQDEYDRAAALPLCSLCERKVAQ